VPEASESRGGTDPEIAFAIFEDAAHEGPVAARSGERGGEALAIQAGRARIGSHPDVAIAVFAQRTNQRVGEAIAHIIFAERARGGAPQQTGTGTDPQVAGAISHQSGHVVAEENPVFKDRNEFPLFQTDQRSETARPYDVMAVFGDVTDGGKGRVC